MPLRPSDMPRFHTPAMGKDAKPGRESRGHLCQTHPQFQAPRQWLVSVRDRDEAETALRFGVQILDLKEPSAGPLSPVAPEVWASVVELFRGQPVGPSAESPADLSAALGEPDQAVTVAAELPPEFRFAKAGPGGCDSESGLVELWRELRNRLPRSVELVAAAYADHGNARCLPARRVVELAARQGFSKILIDTFAKSGRSSLDVMGHKAMNDFARHARRHNMWWALAGSLRIEEANDIGGSFESPELAPDCLAVRGAVCESDRAGTLSEARLNQWRQMMAR